MTKSRFGGIPLRVIWIGRQKEPCIQQAEPDSMGMKMRPDFGLIWCKEYPKRVDWS